MNINMKYLKIILGIAILGVSFDTSGYVNMTSTRFKKTEGNHTRFYVKSNMLKDTIVCGYHVNGIWMKNRNGSRRLDKISPNNEIGPFFIRKEYPSNTLSVVCDFYKSPKFYNIGYKG